jgi:hypothetical protein
MSNDIRDIIERLAILEGRITPVDVKHGLNADQKSVKQLPALFKPKDISPTLSKTPYQKHPMDGWLVGEEVADEEADKELFDAVVVDKDLAIHDPEGERFANPAADAKANTAAKWKEIGDLSMTTTPGYVAGYPNTDNKNVNVDIKGGPGGSGSSATSGVATQPEKDMGPADVVKALPGMKEGNIPDKIPSPLDVINYKDYTRSMKDSFGPDWTPDPEPMKPYDTKNLGSVKYSQPPVEEELHKMLKHAGVKHKQKVKEVAPDEQGGSTGGTVEPGTIPHDNVGLDSDDIPWHASGTLPGEAPALQEAKVDEEKLLDKVKKSLTDYLASVEEKLEKKIDRDLGEKPAARDIGKKDKNDKDLVAKAKELDEDPTQEDPVIQTPTMPQQDPTYAESAPVKTITMEDGRICEIHGNEHSGFEIRHGNRTMKSRFKNIDEAAMALEMYCARTKKQDQSADYIEEA